MFSPNTWWTPALYINAFFCCRWRCQRTWAPSPWSTGAAPGLTSATRADQWRWPRGADPSEARDRQTQWVNTHTHTQTSRENKKWSSYLDSVSTGNMMRFSTLLMLPRLDLIYIHRVTCHVTSRCISPRHARSLSHISRLFSTYTNLCTFVIFESKLALLQKCLSADNFILNRVFIIYIYIVHVCHVTRVATIKLSQSV